MAGLQTWLELKVSEVCRRVGVADRLQFPYKVGTLTALDSSTCSLELNPRAILPERCNLRIVLAPFARCCKPSILLATHPINRLVGAVDNLGAKCPSHKKVAVSGVSFDMVCGD